MATLRRFEDLECWQLARTFNKEIFLLANSGWLAKEFELKGQLKRVALSISNNIAEGFDRYSDKDFIKFLDYSSASCSEIKNMLYLILDLEFLTKETTDRLMKELETIQSKILALIKYLATTTRQ